MLKKKQTVSDPYLACKGKIKHFTAFSCLVTDPKYSLKLDPPTHGHITQCFTPSGGKRQIIKIEYSLEAQIHTHTVKPSYPWNYQNFLQYNKNRGRKKEQLRREKEHERVIVKH